MKKSNYFSKLLALIVMAFVIATSAVPASANTVISGQPWGQFRGENFSQGVTDSKTPRNAQEIKQQWVNNLGSGWSFSDPIVVGDFVYVTDGNNIKKLNKTTGKEIANKALLEAIPYSSRMAYGDGKVFIPTESGKIQAVDANTLEPLWISAAHTVKDVLGLSTLTYYNGYVYTGVSDYSNKEGLFYAVSSKDEDTTKGNEIKKYTWTYETKAGDKGYFWNGGVVVGKNIIFGGTAGEVVSHGLTGNVVDKIKIEGSIMSTIHYDNDIERIYFTTKQGTIYSIKVNGDGTFDKASLISKKIGSNLTSTPVTYKGRVYVAGGGFGSTDAFTVLDAKTLTVIYKIDGVLAQSAPVLTTAYATKENNYKVYIYVINYNKPDSIYCIEDFQGNTKPTYSAIATPSVPQYNSSSVSVDSEGNIYFLNSSGSTGNVFKFANVNGGAYTATDVVNAINRLTESTGATTSSAISINGISLKNEFEVNRVKARYDGLAEAEKVNVTNVAKLNEAIKTINNLKNADLEVIALISEITALPDSITLENEAAVNGLFKRFNALSEAHKVQVTNSAKLVTAKATIDKLVEENNIKKLIESINTLPELKDVVLDTEKQVTDVYKLYEALTDAQKAKVTNVQKLISSKIKIDETKATVAQIEKDIWDKIKPENITLADKENIYDIIKRYEALNSKDKAYVKHYDEVLAAKAIVDKLAPVDKPAEEVKKPAEEVKTPNDKKDGKKLPYTGGNNTSATIVLGILAIIGGSILLYNKKKKEA